MIEKLITDRNYQKSYLKILMFSKTWSLEIFIIQERFFPNPDSVWKAERESQTRARNGNKEYDWSKYLSSHWQSFLWNEHQTMEVEGRRARAARDPTLDLDIQNDNIILNIELDSRCIINVLIPRLWFSL